MSEQAATSTPLVEMRGIKKSFGTVQALRGVDFYIDRPEIVGLLGDNGAGKSTLIKILPGVHTPTSGQIYFEGQPVEINSPNDARHLGIETVYQDLALVPLMSISRNFWLGQELMHRIGPIQVLDKRQMETAHMIITGEVPERLHIHTPDEEEE